MPFPNTACWSFRGRGSAQRTSIRSRAASARSRLPAPAPRARRSISAMKKQTGRSIRPRKPASSSCAATRAGISTVPICRSQPRPGCCRANVIPSRGGGTEFADTRAAYDALDDAMKQRIAGLSGFHSLYASQAKIGHAVPTGTGYGFHTKGAPLRPPLVRTHPVTGRKSLLHRPPYLPDCRGMDDEEAVALVDELVDFACRPPRVYSHQWAVGDLVVWDNRFVMQSRHALRLQMKPVSCRRTALPAIRPANSPRPTATPMPATSSRQVRTKSRPWPEGKRFPVSHRCGERVGGCVLWFRWNRRSGYWKTVQDRRGGKVDVIGVDQAEYRQAQRGNPDRFGCGSRRCR